MSLACLTCQVVQRTQSDLRSYSFSSQEEQQRCGTVAGCWSKKNSQQPSVEVNTVRARVVPVPSHSTVIEGPVSPRLTRCHAVRRDILRDWNFEEFVEGNRVSIV